MRSVEQVRIPGALTAADANAKANADARRWRSGCGEGWHCVVVSHYRPTLGFTSTVDVQVDGVEVAGALPLRYPKMSGSTGSYWLGAGTIEQVTTHPPALTPSPTHSHPH